jgi:hypothetical protein
MKLRVNERYCHCLSVSFVTERDLALEVNEEAVSQEVVEV